MRIFCISALLASAHGQVHKDICCVYMDKRNISLKRFPKRDPIQRCDINKVILIICVIKHGAPLKDNPVHTLSYRLVKAFYEKVECSCGTGPLHACLAAIISLRYLERGCRALYALRHRRERNACSKSIPALRRLVQVHDKSKWILVNCLSSARFGTPDFWRPVVRSPVISHDKVRVLIPCPVNAVEEYRALVCRFKHGHSLDAVLRCLEYP